MFAGRPVIVTVVNLTAVVTEIGFVIKMTEKAATHDSKGRTVMYFRDCSAWSN